MGKIADLYAEVGFKFDSVKLREVSKYIGDLNISSVIAATSLVSLGIEMKSLIDQSASLSNNLNILSTTTGVDPQYIQKLEHAAFVLGSSKQAADQWIASLSALQQKLTVAQGSQQFFTAAQMLGVDPVSFRKIIGNTEQLDQAVRKILGKQWSPSDRMSQEQFARTKTWLAGLINMPADLLTAVQNPDFQKQFDSFTGLSNSEIKQNIESTEKWRSLVDKVNMLFLEMANHYLPMVTQAVDNFVKAGGLKAISDTIQNIENAFERFDIIKNYLKAAAMNVGSAASQPLIASARLHNRLSNAELAPHMNISQILAGLKNVFTPDGKAKTVNVNVAPITITTNNVQEFGKKFQDEFTRALDIATRQSPIGQT